MKKVLSIVLAMLICASLVFTAFAAEDTFTPSVTAKPAPDVVTKDETTGTPVVEVLNDKDELVATFEPIHVVVTPVSEAGEEHVDEEVSKILTEIYEELSAPETKLSEAMPALAEIVTDFDVNDLVIKDLFHIAISEELAKALEGGNVLELTLDAKIAPNQFVVVMVYVDGEWIPVEFVVNEDGTITCTLEVVGVVAILTRA